MSNKYLHTEKNTFNKTFNIQRKILNPKRQHQICSGLSGSQAGIRAAHLQHQQHLGDGRRNGGCTSQAVLQVELQQHQVPEGQQSHLPHREFLTLTHTHRGSEVNLSSPELSRLIL